MPVARIVMPLPTGGQALCYRWIPEGAKLTPGEEVVTYELDSQLVRDLEKRALAERAPEKAPA